MARVDGKWNCTVQSPMGAQDFVLSVETKEDGRFSGSAAGSVGTMTIPDGVVEGDTLSWSMAVAKPLPITLGCKATVNGDTLDGQVTAGVFGSYPIKGTRAG